MPDFIPSRYAPSNQGRLYLIYCVYSMVIRKQVGIVGGLASHRLKASIDALTSPSQPVISAALPPRRLLPRLELSMGLELLVY